MDTICAALPSSTIAPETDSAPVRAIFLKDLESFMQPFLPRLQQRHGWDEETMRLLGARLRGSNLLNIVRARSWPRESLADRDAMIANTFNIPNVRRKIRRQVYAFVLANSILQYLGEDVAVEQLTPLTNELNRYALEIDCFSKEAVELAKSRSGKIRQKFGLSLEEQMILCCKFLGVSTKTLCEIAKVNIKTMNTRLYLICRKCGIAPRPRVRGTYNRWRCANAWIEFMERRTEAAR